MLEKYKVESDQKTLFCSELKDAYKILTTMEHGRIKELTHIEYAFPLERKIVVPCWVPVQDS